MNSELMTKVLYNLDLSKQPLHVRYMLLDQVADEDITRCARCNSLAVPELEDVLAEYRVSIAKKAYAEFVQKMAEHERATALLRHKEEKIEGLEAAHQAKLEEMAEQYAEARKTANKLKSDIAKLKADKASRNKDAEALQTRFSLALQAMRQGDKISVEYAEATLRAMADEISFSSEDNK